MSELSEMFGDGHRSSCAVHNEPAMPNRPCDCGGLIWRDEAHAVIEKLQAALEPFMRAAKVIDSRPTIPKDFEGARGYLPGVWPTVGDLRRARTAYEETK